MNRVNSLDEATRSLLARLDEPEQDPRAGYVALRQRIDALKQMGAPVPVPLVVAERQLKIELAAQSQGR